MPDYLLEWGIAVILMLQAGGDWLIGPMNALTFTGNVEFYLLIMPALYWCYDTRLGLSAGAALMISIGLNGVLKIAAHDPRPYWMDARVRLLGGPEKTFGIPSGHSQNALLLWGLVGAHVNRGWFWLPVVLLIGLVGLSRMYLGVHFPTDVFAGWLLGLGLLFLVLWLKQPLVDRVAAWSKYRQTALAFGFSVAMIAVGAAVAAGVSATWQIPAGWLENAGHVAPNAPIDPLALDDLVTSAAAFFGLINGVIWLEPNFEAGGPWLKRLGRYLVGLIGVLVIWQGLDALFGLVGATNVFLEYTLRYIRYSAVGTWVSGLAPLIFLQLGLTQPGQ